MNTDVVILGGGVAGAAAALALRQHAPQRSVLVVERGGYGGRRIGETLPPQTAPLLRQLGLWDEFQRQGHAGAPGTAAAWGAPGLHRNDFVFAASGSGWHLDRAVFDRWLAEEAVRRGAVLRTQTRLAGQQRIAGGWQLGLQGPDGSTEVRSRFVVDATGRLAVFGRRQGARRRVEDGLVGIVRFFERAEAAAGVLVEARPDGWWYAAALPGSGLVAAFMTDADLARRRRLRDPAVWQAHLGETTHTRAHLGPAVACGPVTVAAAHSQRLDPLAGEGWLAVGDAATAFDPLSSLGLFNALRSAIFGAYALTDALDGRPDAPAKYAALLAAEYRVYLQKRAAYYRQEQRWPAEPFWQRRQSGPAGSPRAAPGGDRPEPDRARRLLA